MRNTSILLPVFALAAWTGLVLVLIAARRLTADIAPSEFALGESARVPPGVRLPNRNYMNLLELPVLFYVVCLVAYVAPVNSMLAVQCAWAYVALRVAHSVIHLTYNKVLHRFVAFGLSNFALIGLWVVVGSAVFGAPGAG